MKYKLAAGLAALVILAGCGTPIVADDDPKPVVQTQIVVDSCTQRFIDAADAVITDLGHTLTDAADVMGEPTLKNATIFNNKLNERYPAYEKRLDEYTAAKEACLNHL